ncbi:cation-translocating P-type ATPase [Psychromarinibacter halotolerans]|uniref:Cation-translocating P-type ATPase n=2 Tax=Psychromarinibacter halotolerans TaxID=1775175 RepID=A0ABV7GZF7_9RHOB|nr:cation-transporting P-type ATPase [Psychromarinibacter halotolerans]
MARDDVLRQLDVDAASGLSTPEARERLLRFGRNQLRRQKPKSALLILLHQFKGLIVWLLLAAAGLSLAFGDTIEAAAIAVILVLNGTIGFVTEFRAARSMEALFRIDKVRTRVRRDGKVQAIDAGDVVPGDIVILEAGDIVTADLRVMSGDGLQCDESVLSGESLPTEKSQAPVAPGTVLADRSSMLFKGTALTGGAGEAVVVATGADSELGRISELVQEASSDASPLEKRLEDLGNRLIWVTFAFAALVIGAGVVQGHPLTDMIQTGVALAVAAIPEGLPVVATLCLARGMLLMANRNALVRRLSSVETLGSTTMILTDKTGTLTENRMTVVRYMLEGRDVDLPQTEPAREGDPLGLALTIGALCNNSDPGDGARGGTGDPMELALMRAAKAEAPRIEATPRVKQYAFDTDSRMMATVHTDGPGFLYAVKGAPEAVMAASTTVLTGDGLRPLTAEDRVEWARRNDEAAATGLRCLGLAMKQSGSDDEAPYSGLTLVGLVCLADPLRTDVPAAISACRRAGIRVAMITGDHAETAARIARDAGICDDRPVVINGADLVEFDPGSAGAEDLERIRSADVYARIAPETKLALVRSFQDSGQIVAVTGDGVNDAPALKKADIGIAMGQRGTQVAHEAAHMVLRDDNFATIAEAVRQGRVIFSNIRRFVVYLMSCNLSEVMVVGLAVGFGLPAPLLPLQILYLNLVTDVFPAFALGMGRGSGDEMHRPPRDPKQPIIGRAEWIQITMLGSFLTATTLIAFAGGLWFLDLGAAEATTVAFVTISLGQLWNVFNAPEFGVRLFANDVYRSAYVWGALGLCLALIALAIWQPQISQVLGLSYPGRHGLMLAVGLSAMNLILGQLFLMAAPRLFQRGRPA